MGGNCPSQSTISMFHEMISDCGLVDLEFKGPKFTWRNNRSGEEFIMERIDLAFANSKWRVMYDRAMVFVELAVGSDHNPLVLNTDVPLNKVGQPFKFESFWVTEVGCNEVIVDSWSRQQDGSLMFTVCKKLKVCKEMLKDWSRRTFGELRFRIDSAKEQLSVIQQRMEVGVSKDLLMEEKRILQVLEDLWQKDAMYWHQRSRVKWLQQGDRNSRFFHLSTIQRRQRNQIVRIKNDQGIWQDNPKDIAGVVKRYFQELYSMPPTRDLDAVIDLIDPSISAECNMYLTRSISKEEVQQAVFRLGTLKAPGSDGFPGLFYQSYWDTSNNVWGLAVGAQDVENGIFRAIELPSCTTNTRPQLEDGNFLKSKKLKEGRGEHGSGSESGENSLSGLILNTQFRCNLTSHGMKRIEEDDMAILLPSVRRPTTGINSSRNRDLLAVTAYMTSSTMRQR
ncbi:hypothetical protein Vadar_006435 [Vaccinium darrowii]|uniref:Uncharacterized protein n=1 Tax=Vaccinium darrowii TaxID=229202 RepID=A0ACB7Z2P2_9ERIC|nr:hypothetical protein Vadar_006435 [Vaccinium darrowii]